MKYIKTYELLNGSRITKAINLDIETGMNMWNRLMVTIASNDMKTFHRLIKTINLEEVDKFGNTALLIATSVGRLKMVKELIKNGADIFHKNNLGEDFYDVAINRFKFINNVKDWIEKTYPEIVMAKKYNL